MSEFVKPDKLRSIFSLICGLFISGIFVFSYFTDIDGINCYYIGIAVGGIIILCSIFSLFFNYNAHFNIIDNRIIAKYNWFGKLDCSIDEVEFTEAKTNTLYILMKNGKRCVVAGIKDPWAFSDAIRRKIFSADTKSPSALMHELESARAARKNELYKSVCCIVLMFAYIFIAVILTDDKELYDFSTSDKIIFGVMCALEVLNFIAMFCFAEKCGRLLLPIEQLEYRLRKAIITTHPLPTGNVKNVYATTDCFERVVICGLPNSDSIYYCVQTFTENYFLETVETSEILASEDELSPMDFFIDIIENTI